jgi:hypothetical protein
MDTHHCITLRIKVEPAQGMAAWLAVARALRVAGRQQLPEAEPRIDHDVLCGALACLVGEEDDAQARRLMTVRALPWQHE